MSMPGATSGKTSPIDRSSRGSRSALRCRPSRPRTTWPGFSQMGVEHAVLWTDAIEVERRVLRQPQEAVRATTGSRSTASATRTCTTSRRSCCGSTNSDAKVEQYKRHLQALGQAGIPYTTYAHMPNGIWSTERERTRGGADARGFDLAKATAGHWRNVEYSLPLTNGREYSEEEIWDNWAEFIRQVAPVAENENVMIGIHPDDPPIPRLGGVSRIF